jgi:CheY-like chemotaxis protein
LSTCATRRLFVAVTPEALSRAHACLGKHYLLTIVTAFSEIRGEALSSADLILCNMQFDEGRMFDLLRYVKSHPGINQTPFLCVNSTSALSPALIQSVKVAARAVGADAFADVFEWRRRVGDDAAYERLRKLVQDLLVDADQEHHVGPRTVEAC